ncbi:hypothetical protein ACFE04_010750 [Oxalis oulophora]
MDMKRRRSEDRISELPDEIIEKFLSLLTFKEAASTSLISKRWRSSWKFYSGCFDFDGSSIVHSLRNRYKLRRKVTALTLHTKRTNFVNWVNRVMESHQGATIKGMRIVFDLKKPFHKEIDKWVQLALLKRVQFIELDLSSFASGTVASTCYGFPLYSSCGFESLKNLCLKHVDMSGDDVQSLVDNCHNLEQLGVFYSESLDGLNLYSPSLKHLTVWLRFKIEYDLSNIQDYKISAPNLLSFSWSGLRDSNLLLEDVPKLKDVDLSGYWYGILGHHSQLEKLSLLSRHYRSCGCENERHIDLPELSNLKDLRIGYSLLNNHSFYHFVTYLNAAPLLENFTLELHSTRIGVKVKLSQAAWNITRSHSYKNLKVVKFIGFCSENDDKFITYLSSHAPLLESITIDLCPADYLGTALEIEYKQSAAYLEAMDRAINLSERLPCQVTVV